MMLVALILAQTMNLNNQPLLCMDEGSYCSVKKVRAFELNCSGAGGTGEEKLRHALGAAKRLDEGDNGTRDWSDAQIRIAIEAALAHR